MNLLFLILNLLLGREVCKNWSKDYEKKELVQIGGLKNQKNR